MIDVGPRIRKLLADRGIKQADLARKIKKTPQALNALLKRPVVGSDWIQLIKQHTTITAAEIFEEIPQGESGLSTTQDPPSPYGNQSYVSTSAMQKRVEHLERELDKAHHDNQHYQEMLAEKERLIQVLMDRK